MRGPAAISSHRRMLMFAQVRRENKRAVPVPGRSFWRTGRVTSTANRAPVQNDSRNDL